MTNGLCLGIMNTSSESIMPHMLRNRIYGQVY